MEDNKDHPLGENKLLPNTMTYSW